MKLFELVVLKILIAILSGIVSRYSIKMMMMMIMMRIRKSLESHLLITIMKIINNTRNIKQLAHKQ